MEEFPCPRGPPKVFWPRLPDGYVPPTAEEIQRKKDERLNKDLAEITRILAEAIEEVQQKKAEKQEEKQPFKFRPSVASWLHLRPHQVAVPLQRVEVEAEDEKAAPTLLQADPPNSLLKKAAAVEKTNPAGPSPLEKEYVLEQHANPKEKEASEQEKAPGPPDAGPLKKKDAEESKSKSCKTATPGDTCYKAVLWAKWIGLIEHPTWYPGLKRATANRMAIQEWLHNNSQGDCHRPCDHETYPIPPSGKGKPSLFCFSVARMGPEMDTMFMQRQMGAGIFACDGHAVYSDTHVNIDGFKTTLIPSTASGVSTDKTAANSQVFMNTWNNLLTTTKWYEYDFIAKVDPDCVFFPARLRGHVHSYVGQNVFFLNCGKYVPATMYGALEVYSKSSLGAYLSAHPRCETSFPFGAWGEDKYMTNCLEMLGCKSVVDFGNFLHDERCWGVDCGNKQAVAFHAFKQVNQWYNCWLLSNHHGFRGVDELVGQCGDPYTPYDINNTLQ